MKISEQKDQQEKPSRTPLGGVHGPARDVHGAQKRLKINRSDILHIQLVTVGFSLPNNF